MKSRWKPEGAHETDFAIALRRVDDSLSYAVDDSTSRTLEVMAQRTDADLVRFGSCADAGEVKYLREAIRDCLAKRNERDGEMAASIERVTKMAST